MDGQTLILSTAALMTAIGAVTWIADVRVERARTNQRRIAEAVAERHSFERNELINAGYRSWQNDPPGPRVRLLECRRVGWPQSHRMEPGQIDPLLNANDLYWRPLLERMDAS